MKFARQTGYVNGLQKKEDKTKVNALTFKTIFIDHILFDDKIIVVNSEIHIWIFHESILGSRLRVRGFRSSPVFRGH